MANVAIPAASLASPEVAVAEPAAASITSADVGTAPTGPNTVLRITSGGVAGTVTIAAATYWESLAIAIGASGTVYVPIDDSTRYVQSDGMLHLSTDQTVTVVALTS